jgi:hypothetical protein
MLHPFYPQHKPHQIGRHHQQNVAHAAGGRYVAIPWLMPVLFRVSTIFTLRHVDLCPTRRGKRMAMCLCTYLCKRKKLPSCQFRQYKQTDEPAPREQLEREVVPERDECKDEQGGKSGVATATYGDVDVPRCQDRTSLQHAKGGENVPDDPKIVASMPTPPEAQSRVIVGHASDHVLGRLYAVE